MATEHNLSYVFPFEKNFNPDTFLEWTRLHWTDSFVYSGIYVATIFLGKYYMKDKPRFEIRYPLALWSAVLAIFSILGAVRTIPELVNGIKNYGFDYSVCNPSYFYGPTSFWAFMFTISKVYELGDTIFIVLRKQQLIFLHWYHHITVMIYVWYSYTDHTAPGRWFMVMNYTVHSVMYSYYALKALRIYVPKFISMIITTMQISQMIMGLVINYRSYTIKARGEYCQQSTENLRYGTMMYFSYFLLFSYFFYNAYLSSRAAKKLETAEKQKGQLSSMNGLNGITEIENHKTDKKRQ